MTLPALSRPAPVAARERAAPVARPPAAARAVLRLLDRLQTGTLQLQLPGGELRQFGNGQPPVARLQLFDWSVCAATLQRGDVGFGEAYVDARWDSPDLPALLRLLLANREALDAALYGRWWSALWDRLRHALHRNTRAGSRRNISAHYDLGNPFYRLWLDETMNYSAAWFDGRPDRPLAEAQRAKMRRALDECALEPGQRLLEIGCGWGAVAELAAAERGLAVTGVTLSREQLAFARDRLLRQGLAADVRLQDYRDIPERGFDAVVSIEMFEAVGQAYWPVFFRAVHDALRPGGRACLQTITIQDRLFDRYLRGTDFIQQYVFPGGLLPCPSAFRAAAREQGLEVVNELDFGRDYAHTLRHWQQAFQARQDEVLALGHGARFLRLWRYYLASCEAAFDSGHTSVMQFTLRRT